jgi:transcriptional regulator with XRE-family HTH domain
MNIGNLIKELRLDRGLSQQDLAKFSKVPFATINKLEQNKANVTIGTLQKVLSVFGYELMGMKKKTQSLSASNEL